MRLLFATAVIPTADVPGRIADERPLTTAEAMRFIQRAGDRLVAILNGDGDWLDKRRGVQALISEVVDIRGIAKFALGRHWSEASDAQRDEIVRFFPRVMLGAITRSVGAFQGMSFTINGARKHDAAIEVATTILRSGDPPRQVNWTVAANGATAWITDIVADGTSLRITERDDTTSFLSHNEHDIQTLIETLRRRAAEAMS